MFPHGSAIYGRERWAVCHRNGLKRPGLSPRNLPVTRGPAHSSSEIWVGRRGKSFPLDADPAARGPPRPLGPCPLSSPCAAPPAAVGERGAGVGAAVGRGGARRPAEARPAQPAHLRQLLPLHPTSAAATQPGCAFPGFHFLFCTLALSTFLRRKG